MGKLFFNLAPRPAVTVTFHVEDVFDQTPGPGAGKPLDSTARGDPMLPDEIKPALQGFMPGFMVTCSLDGCPNATIISQIYWVDERHVALSFQFFNKTIRNVRENPYAAVVALDLPASIGWRLHLRYDHSESEGRLFDEMDMALEAIASMSGLSGVFKLKAADVYEVLSVERLGPPA
jgi:hypothetical protein